MHIQHLLEVLAREIKQAAMDRMHRQACAFARQELPRAPMEDRQPAPRLTFSHREQLRMGRFRRLSHRH